MAERPTIRHDVLMFSGARRVARAGETDVSYDMTNRRLVGQYLCGVTTPTSGPKYLAVREHLRRRVAALPELTVLPPEPVLCAEYGVSRITLRRAVDGLVADGHLVREQGRGTYVTRPAIRHEYRESFVHRIAGFSSVMSEQGAQVGTEVLTQRVVPVPAGVAVVIRVMVRRSLSGRRPRPRTRPG